MAESPDEQVRNILLLPSDTTPRIHDTVNEQIKCFSNFLDTKMETYQEVISQKSVAVFAVNYVQNQFISSEFSVEIARLWEMMNVKSRPEFEKALEALKTEIDTESLVSTLEEKIQAYDNFIKEIDSQLDEKLGPRKVDNDSDEEVPELGIQSHTIAQYRKNSDFPFLLVVVIRSFSSQDTNQHILALYNKINDFHKMGCDVFLLTKGPPIGSRGGAYIKLIGVPFKKLYDEQEAVTELSNHRKSTVKTASWSSLTKIVEASLSDDRPATGEKAETGDDETAFITQKGGNVLIDQEGKVLYKFIEEENVPWPTIDTIVNEVERHCSTKAKPSKPTPHVNNKVESEVSVGEKATADKDDKKKCCTIL